VTTLVIVPSSLRFVVCHVPAKIRSVAGCSGSTSNAKPATAHERMAK
jgi:hypothetical protein